MPQSEMRGATETSDVSTKLSSSTINVTANNVSSNQVGLSVQSSLKGMAGETASEAINISEN